MEPQRPQLLEALLALRALEHAVHRRVRLQQRESRISVRLGELLPLHLRRHLPKMRGLLGGVTRSWTPFTTHECSEEERLVLWGVVCTTTITCRVDVERRTFGGGRRRKRRERTRDVYSYSS